MEFHKGVSYGAFPPRGAARFGAGREGAVLLRSVMARFHRGVRVGTVRVVRERYRSGRLRVTFPPPTVPLWWAGFKPDGDSRGGYVSIVIS